MRKEKKSRFEIETDTIQNQIEFEIYKQLPKCVAVAI